MLGQCRVRQIFWAICVCWTLFLLGGQENSNSAFAEEGRYSAALPDGTRISGSDLKGWSDSKQQPTLNGRGVFDAKNPFRWMIDHSLSPASQPEAYVEFFGGDRLPGEVVGFRDGQESDFLDLPKHLLVNPSVSLNSPRSNRHSRVRVDTRWLKRVVWQPRTLDLYDPGHVFFKDGRALPFRSARWSNNSVTLLLEDGIQEVFFDDLLEIHFPLPDVWSVYYEQMAVLSPGSLLPTKDHARIVQMESADGLKATVSTERLEPFVNGNKNKPESWYHQCQPAWSLDPFWVRFNSVWSRRFFWPHQVPLTIIAPQTVKQKSPLGDSWYWQADRNVYRQPLQSNDQEFGWGFGVHAFHEMTFPLPVSARGFRTRAGLDQSVGEGGCVRWRVSVRGSEEKTLHQSPIVRGTKQVLDSGRLSIPPTEEPNRRRELVLSVDPLLSGSPPGADPLDIRDSLNWLEPELELDPNLLRREIARHSISQVSALAGWKVETDPVESILINETWNEYDRNDPRYRVLLGSRGPFLSLTKSVRIAKKDRWLAIAVCRPDDKSPPSTLHVEIDGAAIAELEIPAARDARGPNPLLVPVKAFRGRTVNVRLVQFPSPQATVPKTPQEAMAFCVDWRGIGTSFHRPGLLPLLAETPDLLLSLTEGEGTAEWDKTEPFSTKTSLKVTPPERGVSRLPGLRVPIRAVPRLGEYRYISFAWKKTDGKHLTLGLAHNGKLGGDNFGKRRPRIRIDPNRLRKNAPARRMLESSGRGLQYGYRYHRGQSNPEIGAAMMVDRKLPEGWQRMERDVFSDFGEFTLTGFSFLPFDGTAAWFDEIYLARDRNDFQYLPSRRPEPPPSADPNVLRAETDPERLGLVTRTVMSPFAVTNSGEGVKLLKEYQGKTNVLRTIPRDQKTPCVLRAPVVLPAEKKSRLELAVNRHKEGDWKLLITANGEKLNETLVSKANTGEEAEKWVQVSVDLSRYAGQPVLLEVQNAANNWHYEDAYWSRLSIVSEPK